MAHHGRASLPAPGRRVRAAQAEGRRTGFRAGRGRRSGRSEGDGTRTGRRGVRHMQSFVRRVRLDRTGQARAHAGEPELRAGRRRAHLGRHRTTGPARPWAREGRPARPRHRRIGRRRDLRRADRQDPRSDRHRRVEHGEAGPRAIAGSRSRHRLHAHRHQRRRQALRRRPRHRRQPAVVSTPPRPHQRRHARHRRWRRRRSLDRRHPPPARRHGAVAVRASASGHIHREAQLHGSRRAPSPHRGRVGYARRRPGDRAGGDPRRDPRPRARTRARQDRRRHTTDPASR